MKKIIPLFIIITIVGVLIYSFFPKTNNNKKEEVAVSPSPQEINKLPVNAINIVFKVRPDFRAVSFSLSGLKEKGYRSFEYEISYDAQSSEDPSQIISQGSGSASAIMVNEEPFEREVLLGTCSKNVCRYDKGVKSVKIIIRLQNKEDTTYLWENEYPLR